MRGLRCISLQIGGIRWVSCLSERHALEVCDCILRKGKVSDQIVRVRPVRQSWVYGARGPQQQQLSGIRVGISTQVGLGSEADATAGSYTRHRDEVLLFLAKSMSFNFCKRVNIAKAMVVDKLSVALTLLGR